MVRSSQDSHISIATAADEGGEESIYKSLMKFDTLKAQGKFEGLEDKIVVIDKYTVLGYYDSDEATTDAAYAVFELTGHGGILIQPVTEESDEAVVMKRHIAARHQWVSRLMGYV